MLHLRPDARNASPEWIKKRTADTMADIERTLQEEKEKREEEAARKRASEKNR